MLYCVQKKVILKINEVKNATFPNLIDLIKKGVELSF